MPGNGGEGPCQIYRPGRRLTFSSVALLVAQGRPEPPLSEGMSSPRDALLRDPPEGETGSLLAFPLAPARPVDNLPLELSSFVGRERELAEVERLLGGTRLVTLSGPGGAGKTRLAQAVAQDLVEEFRDGVWLVELAPISDPELVVSAVAQALGVPEASASDRSPTEALVGHLRARRTLLVLDNCEHLVEGCADLADTLLRNCPDLRILATSREPLRVAGETNFMVPSLSVPDPRRLPSTGSWRATRRSASSSSGPGTSMRASR